MKVHEGESQHFSDDPVCPDTVRKPVSEKLAPGEAEVHGNSTSGNRDPGAGRTEAPETADTPKARPKSLPGHPLVSRISPKRVAP